MTEREMTLEQQLTAIVESIKAYRRDNSRHWYRLKSRQRPWILVLGPESAEKTTLLAQSGLTLRSPIHKNLTPNHPIAPFDFWMHQEAVFIDVSPSLLDVSQQANTLWQRFYALSRRYFLNSPIHNIILTIDLPTLTDPEKQKTLLADVTHHIELLNDRALSITCIITGCDTLVGFSEYFSHLSPEKRQQPFGVTFSETHPALEEFQEYYHTLVKTTSDQLLWQLHQKQNVKDRGEIQNFPSQLEKLGESLEVLIETLSDGHRTTLSGVYLTNHTQPTEKIDLVSHTIRNKLNWCTNPPSQPSHKEEQGPFFVTGLFRQIVTNTRSKQLKTQQKKRWLIVPVMLFAVAATVFFWRTYYEEDASRLTEEVMLLNQNTVKANDSLSRLDALYKIAETANLDTQKTHRFLGRHETKKINQAATSAYQTLLRRAFQPYIQNTLEAHLSQALQGEKVDLYNSLRAYLSLVNTQHANAKVVTEWFDAVWRKQFPDNPERQAQLERHLSRLLVLKPLAWHANTRLIKQARSELQQLPLADAAFLKLQGLYHDDTPISFVANQIQGLDLSQTKLPALYSTEHYQEITNEIIPQLARSLTLGDWVIGKSYSDSTLNESQLVSQLRNIYISYYQQKRLAILPKIRLKPPENFEQVRRAITLITAKDSPLLALLQHTLSGLKTKSTASSFAKRDDTYYRVTYALNDLKEYLRPVLNAENIDSASYTLAVTRFESDTPDPISNLLALSENLDNPMRSWVHTIALSSFKLLLSHARIAINRAWISDVIPEYRRYVHNRYPIFSQSRKDMSFTQFTHFFGPNGTIETFFNSYLKPFVDLSKNYWVWKKRDGLAMGIPQEKLEVLIRASIIQQMFFTDDHTRIFFKFAIMPKLISAEVSRFVMGIDGQTYAGDRKYTKTQIMDWPNTTQSAASLELVEKSGAAHSLRSQGPWAWFRLLNHAQIISKGTESFEATFHIGADRVRYLIIPDQQINPFIPNVMSDFRCPETL